MAKKEKKPCPVCGEMYYNVGAHMTSHEDNTGNIPKKQSASEAAQSNVAISQPADDPAPKGSKNDPAPDSGDTGKLSPENQIKPSSDEEIQKQGLPTKGIRPATTEEAAQIDPNAATTQKILNTLSDVGQALNNLNERVESLETGGKYDFKKDANPEDIERASELRESVQDPRVLKIVDETLGEDFGVILDKNEDKPGFMFRIVVPPRLSPREPAERPVRKEDASHPRDYKTDPQGDTIMERYHPKDIRSRAINSKDSYDTIRDHCLKVQANIIAEHQKENKPTPQFKVKEY